jgi:hypothetical protein
VDLSRDVVVGEPVKKSALHWAVPYNVRDKAGNAATTVWRDVLVEEVALDEFETKLRQDILNDKQAEIDRAVTRALEEERRKQATSKSRLVPVVPERSCPKCECSNQFDPSMCDAICEKRGGNCPVDEQSSVVLFLVWLETVVPPSLIPALLGFLLFVVFFICLRLLWNLLFRSSSGQSSWYASDERERAMQNAVTYYEENGAAVTPFPTRTTASLGVNAEESMFTPRSSILSPESNGGSTRKPANLGDSIYDSGPIITPSKRGDGVRRRSPYSDRH